MYWLQVLVAALLTWVVQSSWLDENLSKLTKRWDEFRRQQAATADHRAALKAQTRLRAELAQRGSESLEVPELGMRFVPIPAGHFRMGRPRDGDPPTRVEITRDFLIAETEVTQGQWQTLVGGNPSWFSGCGPECPVERINWFEAVAYANRLSELEDREACYVLEGCVNSLGGDLECGNVRFVGLDCSGYRLPTEAEWEYAARVKLETAFATGDHLTVEQANFLGEAEVGLGEPVAVRTFEPNAFGLYEVHGNVWEWTQDWFGWLPEGRVVDPLGPAEGKKRSVRGGGWNSELRFCRSTFRGVYPPEDGYGDVGFRLVRTLSADS